MLALVEGLPNREFVASLHGPEFRGWDPVRTAVADLWDLTAATAQVKWPKGKAPTYPRPSSKQEKRNLSPFAIFGGVT